MRRPPPPLQGNDLDQQLVVTYRELLELVCQAANYLKSIGIRKGDDVTIYMPMIPELPAMMVRSRSWVAAARGWWWWRSAPARPLAPAR